MKGQMLAYAGVAIILILGAAFFIKMSATEDVERTIITSEGAMISFVNDADFILRNFNESVSFVSSRAAYDLGKNGGMENNLFWTVDYPTIDQMKIELIERINDNLAQSYEEGTRKIIWMKREIDVSGYNINPCGPISESECFYVKGSRYFSILDETIDASISLDVPIDAEIPSSYFKLLDIGREIFEREEFRDALSDYVMLEFLLFNEYDDDGIRVKIEMLSDDIIEITLKDTQCYPWFYCLSPLKHDESDNKINFGGSLIPYDFLTLKFRVNVEQIGDTDPRYDFSLRITDEDGDNEGEDEVVCP